MQLQLPQQSCPGGACNNHGCSDGDGGGGGWWWVVLVVVFVVALCWREVPFMQQVPVPSEDIPTRCRSRRSMHPIPTRESSYRRSQAGL